MEYCNHPGGTYWSDLRAPNGATEPHGVRMWCLGNEMDGPWQIGHKTADEYGRLAAETAKAMRLVDPAIELVACGMLERGDADASATGRPTVLGTLLRPRRLRLAARLLRASATDDRASFLACAADMDRFIEAVIATADHVRAKGRHAQAASICRSTSGTSGTR